jgi:hypothetical protein
MSIALALFCIFMTILAVWNCWVPEKTPKFNTIASILTICSGITGYFVLYKMLPTPASPEINDVFFYAQGGQAEFSFCCEFLTRNDGGTICTIDKVEFFLSDVQFKRAKSVLLTVGQGGSSGRYSGPGPIRNEVATSFFPQSISSINQSFKVVGSGKSSTLENKNFYESEVNVVIKFYFNSKNKPFVIERTVPILPREMQNMRF